MIEDDTNNMSTSHQENSRADASTPTTSSALSTLQSKNNGSSHIWLVGKNPQNKSELSVKVFEVWVYIQCC